MITFEGTLERITYKNHDNHYTIARLKADKTESAITIIGYLAGVNTGEKLKITGKWETHPKYGQQFAIATYEVTLPSTLDGIQRYLQTSAIQGVGPKIAAKLIDHFGTATLEMIETHPDRLLEVEGIGNKKAEIIADAWREHHTLRRLMQYLQDIGVKASHGAKLLRRYGPDALTIIREDPFRIATDFPGTGFYIADAVAGHQGLPCDHPSRVNACIIHEIEQGVREGHTYIQSSRLFERCDKLFGLDTTVLRDGLNRLADQGTIIIETASEDPEQVIIFLKTLHQAEIDIANRIAALLSVPLSNPGFDSQAIKHHVFTQLAVKPSAGQMAVLEQIFTQRVAIITGGPGTGKTTLIRSIHTIFEVLGHQICLTAPTGRAARRLSEVTRRKAYTIHKLLGYNLADQSFEKNRDNPIEADVVIVDETSMVDTLLMSHLVCALPATAVLILVGDIFQLPSVGPGNVLSDMIQSNRIKAFKLTKIFRQAHESPIVINAHRIRKGRFPHFDPPSDPDGLSEFYFIQQGNPEKVVDTIVSLCSQHIPMHFDLDPVRDIQILTPMHKGMVGTINLNRALQNILNPNVNAPGERRIDFKPGDKVMHLKNNYQKDVFNGDIGMVKTLDPENQHLAVDYDGRNVDYDFAELDELALAYAISVHKSQGSEYPAVIIPLMTQHYVLLQRNLLYTAVTRAKKLVILVGTHKALDIALKNDKPQTRFSNLVERLLNQAKR